MQTASARIWISGAVSISYNSNHCNSSAVCVHARMCFFLYIYIYIYIYIVCMHTVSGSVCIYVSDSISTYMHNLRLCVCNIYIYIYICSCSVRLQLYKKWFALNQYLNSLVCLPSCLLVIETWMESSILKVEHQFVSTTTALRKLFAAHWPNDIDGTKTEVSFSSLCTKDWALVT